MLEQEQKIKTFEDSLLYAVEKTSMYYRIKGAQFFSNYEVTAEQFCVLEALYYSQEEKVCQRDISKKILKDRSNTGRLLNILEEKRFVSRVVDTRQKRLVKMVSITQKGKELYEKISPEIKKVFLKTLDGVSMEELDFVKNILRKIRENLSKDITIQI